jgi:hypothetical protein
VAIAPNRYFNNPGIAQAAANLSSLFAPAMGAESAADAAGYALADARRAEMNNLGRLFDYAQDPDLDQTRFDRMGLATGRWTPNQSFYSVDQGNLTSRANNAADNQRALQTNVLDNQRQAITSLFDTVSPGEIRPAVPQDLMGVLGLPGIDQVTGAPKPLTETEVNAARIQSLPLELQDAIAFGNTPVENIVTPEGPRVQTRFGSIGQEPVINKGAEASAKLLNYQTPDGRSGSALFDPGSQTLVDATTREPLPQGTRTYTGQLSGSQDETGLGLTGATQSRVQQQLLSTDQTLDTARTLRDLVSSSPSSQGLVGSLRGTAQDIVQTGGDLGQFFGGAIEEANQAVRNGMLDAGVAAQNFDPNIPAIQMMTNLLAWQYAKALSGDRVSNEQLNQARVAIGGEGIFANRANTLTRLDQLIQSMERQRANLQPMAPGVGYGNQPVAAPAGGATRLRFDANGNPIQ